MRLVYVTLGWVAGIVLAATWTAVPTAIWPLLAVVLCLALWLLRQNPDYRLTIIALLALALGGWRFSFVPATSDIAAFNNSGGLTMEGVITDEPDVRDDRVQMRISTETVTRAGETVQTSGLVLVQAIRTTDVHYGDRITATGSLITPAEGDTFSYADYLARSGVFSIMRNAAVEVVSGGHGSPFYAALLDLKTRAHEAIARNLPEPEAALLSGILLGNQRGIPPEIENAFSRVGASHIIAISGFNMVIISGVVMGTLNRLTNRRWMAALLGIGVVAAYTLFVGANPAVVRAAIMSSLLVIAPLLKRKTYVPTSLVFVALALSLFNPTVLWDVSFQLSFFATLGLALFADPLSARFDALLHRLFPPPAARAASGFLTEPLIVSIAAQLTTLPLILLYFGRLSLVSLVVNLLIIPAQTLLLILGGLATLLAFVVPGLAQLLYWFDLLLLSWTMGVVRNMARLPFADVAFYVDARLIGLFFLVLIGGALMQAVQPAWALVVGRFIRSRMVMTATVFSGLAIFLLTGALFLSRPDRHLHVWMLDMGHSNAVLVQTPGGAHMLVDGGRFPSRLLTAIGDRLPFNDREIEVLVITQPDEYEYSALTAVADRYDIGVVLTNGQPNLSPTFLELQDKLARHEVLTVRAGYTVEVDDGTRLEILHPQRQPELGDSLDDYTLVMRLAYGQVSFLLTSDLSAEGQAVLLKAGQWPLAAVLQLPKHGAVRSLDKAFLQAVQPQVVVLQSDPANRLGDPDPDTLALLGDIPLFRTDSGGTIHLWTDGQELWTVQDTQ